MWRRWALHDPESGHDGIGRAATRVDVDAARLRLARGSLPDPGWTVRPEPEWPDLPVQRQPPEEEGRIPRWVGATPA